MSDHVELNHAFWEADADDYQRRDAPFLKGAAWGVWQIPEEERRILGGVAGRDVLEWCCYDARAQRPEPRLQRPCFGLHRWTDAESTYRDADDRAWARSRPMEHVWKVRRR